MKYLLKHIGLYLVAAWASLTLNFILPRTMPGDPVASLVGRMRGKFPPQEIEALRAAYGFNDAPVLQQYFQYLGHMLTGDFGLSISAYPVKVTTIISTALFWTLLLGMVTLLLSFLIGTGLGALVGWRRGGVLDSILPGFFSFIGSFPYFFLAMLALFLLGFVFRWFPMAHAYSDQLSPAWSWEFVKSVLYHLVMPAGTVIIISIAGWLVSMRSTMVGVLAEDYITMAEAKGLSQWRVMYHYAMRNAILPNVTEFGMAIGFILSGLILTELVFSYPGLGFYLVRAVNTNDYPLMQALFFMITLAVLGANLIVDLLYIRLDPRVRA